MYDPSGRFTGYRGIGKDMTESIRRNDESPINSKIVTIK
jgi:hypothetical protein